MLVMERLPLLTESSFFTVKLVLGYIARRPAFRENRGLACAQVGSPSRAFTALHDENWRSPSDALLAKIPTVVIDRIHIEQLAVYGRVGVPDSERAEPQRLSLNVTLWPKRSRRICWRSLICVRSRSKCANLFCPTQTMFQ